MLEPPFLFNSSEVCFEKVPFLFQETFLHGEHSIVLGHYLRGPASCNSNGARLKEFRLLEHLAGSAKTRTSRSIRMGSDVCVM